MMNGAWRPTHARRRRRGAVSVQLFSTGWWRLSAEKTRTKPSPLQHVTTNTLPTPVPDNGRLCPGSHDTPPNEAQSSELGCSDVPSPLVRWTCTENLHDAVGLENSRPVGLQPRGPTPIQVRFAQLGTDASLRLQPPPAPHRALPSTTPSAWDAATAGRSGSMHRAQGESGRPCSGEADASGPYTKPGRGRWGLRGCRTSGRDSAWAVRNRRQASSGTRV